MHRVHRSVRPAETNGNLGFTLPCWDRLLGTYRMLPAVGCSAMTIRIFHFGTHATFGSTVS
jgi:sterol desaturase/sphingolipid hydroxylase (fatty acid hydroxylase superfamily)